MQELEDADLEAMLYEEALLEEISHKEEQKILFYGDDEGRAE